MSEQFLNYTPHRGGLIAKVLAFFVANPDEALTSADIADKWDVRPPSAVWGALARPVNLGLLRRSKPGKHTLFEPGPNLGRWALNHSVEPENRPLMRQVDALAARARAVTPVGAIDIRVTLRVHGAGTPFQRVELAGVEP